MRPRSIHMTAALLLALVTLAAGGSPAPPTGDSQGVPIPCFVPPHPKKQGSVPGLSTPRGGSPPRTIGGAGSAYRDDHLTGVLSPGRIAAPGTLNILAVLVDFEDQEMGARFAAQQADSSSLYFARVLRFLDEMYGQMSGNRLQINWNLTPVIYRLPQTMAYYGLDDSIATREAELARDAVFAADADVDFSAYDTFVLFHAGPGQEADINSDSEEEIWSVFFRQVDFQYWVEDPAAGCRAGEYSPDCRGIRTNDLDPVTGQPFWVDHTVILPEMESQDGFEFGILGVVAHEFGHRFGLPDLYDTTAPDDFIFADSQGIGAFGLMGAGIWNEGGFFPAEMCAWSKFYTGWLRPRVIRPDELAVVTQETLAGVQNDRREGALRIPLGGDEYFLIENRLRDYDGDGVFDFDDQNGDGDFDFWEDSYAGCEFDWFLPRELSGNAKPGEDGAGLLIWHIDESVVRDLLLFNLVNAEALHKGVDLEEADGIQDLDKLEFTFEAFGDSRDAFWAPHATEFTPHTTPSTDGYNNTFSGVWITDISGPGQTMTLNIRFTSPGGGERGDLRAGWPRDLPGLVGTFQPVTGDIDGDNIDEIILGATDENGFGGLVVLNPDGTSFFSPGAPPEFSTWGELRSSPILADMDPFADTTLEMIWVSGDTVYVRKGTGMYIGADGSQSALPTPYATLGVAVGGRVSISADHLEPVGSLPVCGRGQGGEDLLELVVAFPLGSSGITRFIAIGAPGMETPTTHLRVTALLPGDPHGYPVMANIDTVDGGLRELVTSTRTPEGGLLAVALYDFIDAGCSFIDVRWIAFSLGDTVAFTAPVVGDLNRDGIEEIVFGDSEGYVHVLGVRIRTADGITKELGAYDKRTRTTPSGGGFVQIDNSKFEEHRGWPVFVGALEDDELSLADVDGDGYLEILVFGADNHLQVLNYNGTSVLNLPVEVPAEFRFSVADAEQVVSAAYLSPLVLDITGDRDPEMLLPLPDGQIRGHDLEGRRLEDWAYLGGGNQETYPIVTDLELDGELELITVEDVTVEVPLDSVITRGDEATAIRKQGRIMVREVGAGSATGSWPRFRHDVARTGRAPVPGPVPPPASTAFLTEAFVMPNPVVNRNTTGFHYKVRPDVDEVTIEVYTMAGRLVETLTGSVFVNTDNLVTWDLTNSRGRDIAPGLYIVRFQTRVGSEIEIQTGNFVVVR